MSRKFNFSRNQQTWEQFDPFGCETDSYGDRLTDEFIYHVQKQRALKKRRSTWRKFFTWITRLFK